MTTDDQKLTEQIARALTEAMYGADVEERARRALPDQADRLLALYHQQSMEYAAAVLPIIRKAQERAWDDCAHEADRRWIIGAQSAALLHDANPYREEQNR